MTKSLYPGEKGKTPGGNWNERFLIDTYPTIYISRGETEKRQKTTPILRIQYSTF